jgi:hypothetical protein
MKITVWVVSTCIPERGAEPCQPLVFGTEAEAEVYADQMLRNEWEEYADWNDDGDKQLPYPGDWRAANDVLVRMVGDGSWGQWQITSHEIEIATGPDFHALARRLSDALLKVRPLGGSEMVIRVGDEYFADPEYCGQLITEHREREHKALMDASALRKSLHSASEALLEAADKFNVIHHNHPGSAADAGFSTAQAEDKAFCAELSDRMLAAKRSIDAALKVKP